MMNIRAKIWPAAKLRILFPLWENVFFNTLMLPDKNIRISKTNMSRPENPIAPSIDKYVL